MHYNYIWHIKSIYSTKFQVNTVNNIEVIWKNVLSHARVMVIGVMQELWLLVSVVTLRKKLRFYTQIFFCLNGPMMCHILFISSVYIYKKCVSLIGSRFCTRLQSERR